jgi:hypothetical protein
MDDKAKDELRTILAAYKARVVDAQERDARVIAARASFVDEFRSLKVETIAPILDDFAAQLEEQGHEASVVAQEEASDRNGRFAPASIALRIVPARIGEAPAVQSNRTPIEVIFSANQHAMKVLVSSSNNGHGASGRRGDYDVAQLTTEFVVSNVLRTIRDALAVSQ